MSVIKGVLIPSDDEQPVQAVELDPDDYRNFQKFVGGLFEIVEVPRCGASMYFDEEGKLKGSPLNKRATEFLYAHRNEFVGYDVILGDVLVLGGADKDGNTLSVPEALSERLTASQ